MSTRCCPKLTTQWLLLCGSALVAHGCVDVHNRGVPEGLVSPSLSVQNPATVLLAGKTAAGEMLIAAAEVQLPLTNKTLYEGKFFSTIDGKLRGRAYNSSGVLVDAKGAGKAERAAYRSQYGAWSRSDVQLLKGMAPTKQVTASLWVGFWRRPGTVRSRPTCGSTSCAPATEA